MGKRSNFEKRPKDVYLTPISAVKPLITFLPEDEFTFAEPCAGDGRLIHHIESMTKGKCNFECDIDPKGVLNIIKNAESVPFKTDIQEKDAFDITVDDLIDVDMIITNPPWSRDKESDYILHNLIMHFSSLKPTWLVFDADWMHTVQAEPYLKHCTKIVSVGRAKWIENSPNTGKDNVAWYHFDQNKNQNSIDFYGRVKVTK